MFVSPETVGENRQLSQEEIRQITLRKNEEFKKLSDSEKQKIWEDYQRKNK